MLGNIDWFNALTIIASIITILSSLNFVFRKIANNIKQNIAKVSKGTKLRRIKKLRRQYFTFKDIENNTSLLISYSARNIVLLITLFMMMVFLGFIFTYLETEPYKSFFWLYMLLLFMVSIYHVDDFVEVLRGLKNPGEFKKRINSNLRELRIKA